VDRRFFMWLMLTTCLFFLYLSFQQPPPPPEQAEVPGLEEQARPDDPNPLFRKDLANDPPDSGQMRAADTPDAIEDPNDQGDPGTFERQVVTLGSMDPAKGFNLLVTLTSQGASIERAELVEARSSGRLRFIALEHNAGYLGYLGVAESDKGPRIRVVPHGSPASLATSPEAGTGLQVGDVLFELQGTPVLSRAELEAALRRTRPGDRVEVKVYRDERVLNFQAVLSQAPMDIVRTQPFASEEIDGNFELTSLRTTLASINSTKVPVGKIALPALMATLERDWQVLPLDVEGGEGVEFRMPLNNFLKETEFPDLDLVKRYRLYPKSDLNDGYVLDYEIIIENRNENAVGVALRQEGLAGLTLEGWWYSVKISQSFFSGAGQRDVAFADQSGIHTLKTTRDIHSFAKKNPSQPHSIIFSEGEPMERRSLNYVGLDSQYFNASLMPHPAAPDSLSDLAQAGARIAGDVSVIDKSQIQAANTTFWIDTKERLIEPSQSQSYRYSIFLGPKDAEILAHHGLDAAIEYGWFPWIAKPLGWLLHFFHAIVRNYGLAIIMLTVCVRLFMFPLGRRAAITGQRMQELQPEIKKINEKYPDNMEKRARAMQELYRKHDFKPLAGCLPLFIQLPIFIGLYRCLSVDISLRQEPLIPGLTWCSNLAGPDQFYDWSGWMWDYLSGRGTGWLGPYFNILPMITVVLFLLQQKMLMPKATDPQTQMTQSMMKYMTVFMGVIFFKVPAGLCIYFITSSIWSLIERQLVKRTIPPPKLSTADAGPPPEPDKGPNNTPKPKPNPRGRREPEPAAPTAFDRWKKLLDKPAVRSGTQRGTKKRRSRKN
jgi:YidC/Oxa1 family membrane protein insertase